MNSTSAPARAMPFRTVGRSGLRTSVLSYGLWTRAFDSGSARDAAAACVKTALDLGVSTFDVADGYAGGEAERFIGAQLAGLPRDSVVIVSKCFFPTGAGANERGLSRKHIVASIDRSLERLKAPYVDLYLAHRPDPDVPMEEIVRAFDEQIRAGKLLYWGVSRWSAAELRAAVDTAAALGASAPTVNQTVFNLLKPEFAAGDGPAGAALGVGGMGYSPLAQGVLSGKYAADGAAPAGSRGADPALRAGMWDLTPESLAKTEALQRIAAVHGLPLAALAIAWTLRQPYICSVVLGASAPEQLRANAQALEIAADHPALDELDGVVGTKA